MGHDSQAWIDGGDENGKGQLIRWVPRKDNQGGGKLWRGVCFAPIVKDLSNAELEKRVKAAAGKQIIKLPHKTQTVAEITVAAHPTFSFGSWGHNKNPLPNDGLNKNPCWPSKIAPQDPGFAILTYDPYYNHNKMNYKYNQAYDPPNNGV